MAKNLSCFEIPTFWKHEASCLIIRCLFNRPKDEKNLESFGFRVENVEIHTVRETVPRKVICADSEENLSGFRNYSSTIVKDFIFIKK